MDGLSIGPCEMVQPVDTAGHPATRSILQMAVSTIFMPVVIGILGDKKIEQCSEGSPMANHRNDRFRLQIPDQCPRGPESDFLSASGKITFIAYSEP